MKKSSLFLSLLLVFGSFSTPAAAGPFSDELARCLVKSTSDDDRALLIRWIYTAISLHPKVAGLTEIDPADAEKTNRQTAELFMTLIADRCGAEAREALQYDGQAALESSFSVLGQVAMQGIMSDPNVGSYMGGLDKYMDEERLQSIMPQQ